MKLNNNIKLLLKRIYRIIPRPITYLFRNNGGINKDINAFAGNLIKNNLNDKEYKKITYNLIFSNGVRKTTEVNRYINDIKAIFPVQFNLKKKAVKVLDIGSSIGLAAIANYDYLSEYYNIKEYVLGDLYTKLYYEKKKGLIFDEYGNLLQILRQNDFISMNFEFCFKIEKVKNVFKQNYVKSIDTSSFNFIPENCEIIELIHPRISEERYKNVFKLKNMNVFEPIDDKYDIILCFHLLIKRYFNEKLLFAGKNNLYDVLEPGGVLVVGETGKYEIVKKEQ